MALTVYKAERDLVQVPSGQMLMFGEKIKLDSADATVAALVAANLLVESSIPDESPQLAQTVVTGQVKPPLLRDATGNQVEAATMPRDMTTYVPGKLATEVFQ